MEQPDEGLGQEEPGRQLSDEAGDHKWAVQPVIDCQIKKFPEIVAESEGFEPPDLLQSTVFKTAAFDRSANSPVVWVWFGEL